MADLLEQFDGTLGRLKAMSQRGQEVTQQASSLRQRTELAHQQFTQRSGDLLPRARGLVSRLGNAQGQMQEAFGVTMSQLRTFREGVQGLDQECRSEGALLLEAMHQLQQEHSNLQEEAKQLLNQHQNSIMDHAFKAQDSLQSLAPQLVALDGDLREKVMPHLMDLAGQLVTSTGKVAQQVEHEVVPALQTSSRALQQGMEKNAEEFRVKARQLAEQIDAKTLALMQEANRAAQKIHENSNTKLLGLVGQLDQCFTSFNGLAREIARVMKGLHGTKRIAMGTLDLIIEIIDELVTILEQLAAEG